MLKKILPYIIRKNINILFLACFSLVLSEEQKTNLNLSTRKLAETSQKTCKICSKTSDEYSQYYKTGDTTKINMDEDNTEKYDSYYIKALINIVRHYYENKKAKKKGVSINPDPDFKKHVLKYAYHILPLVIVLGLGILSLVVWIVWAICVCKKCSCCYCNRPKCKTPSIVLALIFYAIVSLISVYALIEQDKIFTGLADLECSVLKFTDEVLEGEKNPFPPFWVGIEKMKQSLVDISGKIDALKISTPSDLTGFKGNIDSAKNTFEGSLKAAGTQIDSNFKTSINSYQYQLDIAKQFGTFDNALNPPSPEDSVCYYWYKEYSSLASRAETEMTNSYNTFGVILNDPDITDSLTNANNALDSIKTEFETLEYLLSDYIKEKGDDIDKKGKIIYALFFSLLVIFSVAIIILMLLLCCCSGKICTNLSCFQCFFKYFLHVFWNIMALMMFILFMGGSMFTMAGKIGEDLVGAISFLISKDNLDQDKNTIILGDVKQYLNKCFNDDGNILAELGFDSKMDSFKDLKESKLKIEEIINQFNDKTNKFVYKEYLEEYNERINYNSPDLELVAVNSGTNPASYNFVDLLTQVNTYANQNSKYENWFITGTSADTCVTSNPTNTKINYHPNKCFPTQRSWVNSDISDVGTKLDAIKTIIDAAKDGSTGIISLLTPINTKYDAFLEAEIQNLQKYVNKMKEFTKIVEKYTSEDGEFFSFMNCNFLKTNAEVVLFYLKHSFGNDFFEVGVYLLIAAFSMPFAISFTILLIVISNEEIEKNKVDIIKRKERENKVNKILNNINNDETSLVKNGNMTEKEHLNEKIKEM